MSDVHPKNRCRVCGGSSGGGSGADSGGLCACHEAAWREVCGHYPTWEARMGAGWGEYLAEVARNPLTGAWVREVAEFMIRNRIARQDRRA